MNYENYMELYEAIYFFDRINQSANHQFPHPIQIGTVQELGIKECVYRAVLRILVVNNLMEHDGKCFIMTDENRADQQNILENIIYKDPNKQYEVLFDKALRESHYFFDSISDSEYDLYSRCDFEVTYEIGKSISKYINLTNRKVLELGGNSGGLGTALLSKSESCLYTIVDTKIPCKVGNEFKSLNNIEITFIEGDVFNLSLPKEQYDCIILMNLLHDFDDHQCLKMLKKSMKYSDANTKILIIEDILTNEFEPREVIMHGLRLAVECRGGKQRTIDEYVSLFSNINYELETSIRIDCVHNMLVMSPIGLNSKHIELDTKF